MEIGVIYYSLSGNNQKVARKVAEQINTTPIKITESKGRTIKTIIWDNILHRNPKILLNQKVLTNFDLVIYFAPVWMDKIASPLRPLLKYHKKNKLPYCFFTISGGALGENKKTLNNLIKYTKTKPIRFKQFYVADMMNDSEEINIKSTIKYHINDQETIDLKNAIVKELNTAQII